MMDDLNDDEAPKGRYLLFGGDIYYPAGGWDDFRGDFDTVEEAVAEGRKYDWHHVIDSQTFRRAN